MQSEQCGDLKRELKDLINLPSNIGSQGSLGAMSMIMDEALHKLQSMQICQCNMTS